MLCCFYRAAVILCTFCPVHPVTQNAASSDCAYHIGIMKAEEDVDMQGEEGEVNVKTEKGIGCEEEECIGVKDEDGVCCEEELYIDVKEEEDVGLKEEVSIRGTV